MRDADKSGGVVRGGVPGEGGESDKNRFKWQAWQQSALILSLSITGHSMGATLLITASLNSFSSPQTCTFFFTVLRLFLTLIPSIPSPSFLPTFYSYNRLSFNGCFHYLFLNTIIAIFLSLFDFQRPKAVICRPAITLPGPRLHYLQIHPRA